MATAFSRLEIPSRDSRRKLNGYNPGIMGIFFGKSFKIGRFFRLNFSKGGVGLSAGVKGAHIGVGPRGTYVSGGRNGIYFREKFGSPEEPIP